MFSQKKLPLCSAWFTPWTVAIIYLLIKYYFNRFVQYSPSKRTHVSIQDLKKLNTKKKIPAIKCNTLTTMFSWGKKSYQKTFHNLISLSKNSGLAINTIEIIIMVLIVKIIIFIDILYLKMLPFVILTKAYMNLLKF